MIGVGGLVVNDKKQILVVSEKYYKYPHWKLPGGGVDPGNYITRVTKQVIIVRDSTAKSFEYRVQENHF